MPASISDILKSSLPALAAALSLIAAASAQEEQPLFRAVQAPALAKAAVPAFARARSLVSIDWRSWTPTGDSLSPEGTAARLNLALPGGLAISAVRSRVTWRGPRSLTWVGRVGDEDAILSVRGNAMAGVIHAQGKTFEITPVQGNVHQIIEVDMDRMNEVESDGPGDEAEERVEVEPYPQPPLAGGAETVIDVLVLYDNSAASAVGDIEAFTASLIEQTNEAYVRSKIPQKLRLVHTRTVGFSFTSPGSLGSDPTAVKLRDQYGADLVSLIQGSLSGCGIGNISGPFTLVSRSCALSNKSFAHELGHNMGARHNLEEDGSTGYAHGWYNKAGNWRTIMSYAISGCSCPRINNFSNPDVMHNGVATGVADTRDNARKMRERTQATSDFRKAITPTGINLVVMKTGMGKVTSDLPAIDCGTDCSENFPLGTSTKVTLIARPDSGWTFKGWSGDCQGTLDCALTVNDNMQATAMFENPNFIRFSLVDAAQKKTFLDLKDSTSLDMGKLPAGFTVEAIPAAKVGSIVFNLSGMQTLKQIQTRAPYTLFSETTTGIYNPWNPQVKPGLYTILATAYSGSGGSGDVLGKSTIKVVFKSVSTDLRSAATDARTRYAVRDGVLEFTLADAEHLSLSIRSLDGRSVSLADWTFASGRHALEIPETLSPGLHFLHVREADHGSVLKFTILR